MVLNIYRQLQTFNVPLLHPLLETQEEKKAEDRNRKKRIYTFDLIWDLKNI